MAQTKKKRFTLDADSVEELDRGIQTFRGALRLRYGSIRRIESPLPADRHPFAATVYYQLQVASLRERHVSSGQTAES